MEVVREGLRRWHLSSEDFPWCVKSGTSSSTVLRLARPQLIEEVIRLELKLRGRGCEQEGDGGSGLLDSLLDWRVLSMGMV